MAGESPAKTVCNCSIFSCKTTNTPKVPTPDTHHLYIGDCAALVGARVGFCFPPCARLSTGVWAAGLGWLACRLLAGFCRFPWGLCRGGVLLVSWTGLAPCVVCCVWVNLWVVPPGVAGPVVRLCGIGIEGGAVSYGVHLRSCPAGSATWLPGCRGVGTSRAARVVVWDVRTTCSRACRCR